jgi:signal transduction histidine kinase
MDPLRPPLLRQLRPAHWVAIDAAVTALLALTAVVAFRELADLRGVPRWGAAAIVAVAVLPAAARRRWPRAALALVVAGAAVAMALSTSPAPALAAAFVMYLIPLRRPRREAVRLLAGTLAGLTAGLAVFALVPHAGYGPAGLIQALALLLESAILVTAAWMIGYSVRQQRAYSAGLREQSDRRARDQLAEAGRARSEERLQIARELHDVVAHTMGLITVQAGVANYVVRERPEEAVRALSSIEEISRGALREMRALLGVLRAEEDSAEGRAAAGNGVADHGDVEHGHEELGVAWNGAAADAAARIAVTENGAGPGRRPAGDADLVPAPGLADLGRLAERTAEAGLRVDLDIAGERPALPAGLDLAAYRVIQEAITNVIKHAAADRCRVRVACQDGALTLEVTDDGSARGRSASPVPGHGIAGMQERVGMYGGEFRAAPLPGRGFRVTARFPLADPA